MFTGDSGIRVELFLRRMDSWYAAMGEELDGKTAQSKRMRVAHIHMACPIRSVTGRFIQSLSDKVLWDENALRHALIQEFQDGETDDQLLEEILSRMRTIRQGDLDVFSYSRRVRKLLQRKPSRSQQYNKVFIRYYINRLASRRLRDMATLDFLRADSRESPHQVIKGVMRFATESKIEGYRKDSSWDSNDDDDDDEDDDNPVFGVCDSSSDYESDEDDYYGASRKKKKSDKSKRSSGERVMRLKRKQRKDRNGRDDKATSGAEMNDLREMMRDLERMHKATITAGTRFVARLTDEDGNPLETYSVGRNARYQYEQYNTSQPTTRRTEYSNRQSRAQEPEGYYQEHRGEYVSYYDYGHPETGRAFNESNLAHIQRHYLPECSM